MRALAKSNQKFHRVSTRRVRVPDVLWRGGDRAHRPYRFTHGLFHSGSAFFRKCVAPRPVKHIAVKIDWHKRENSRTTPSGSTRRRLIACVLSLPRLPSRQPVCQENQESLGMPFVSLTRRRRGVDGWAEEKRERRSASLANREARRSFMGRM